MWKKCLVAVVVLSSSVAACSSESVSASDLSNVVRNDGIPFQTESIPSEVVEFLAPFQVVVLGETHLIREHHELVPALVAELHTLGFRQLLLEWPYGADWVMADYVSGGNLVPAWRPPDSLYGRMITGLRDLNLTLSENQRVTVRGIDVNLDDYGGAAIIRESLRDISGWLDDTVPIEEFLTSPYATADDQVAALEQFRDALDADSVMLESTWGADWYLSISEMVDVERASVTIRELRDDGYDQSVRLREDEMKRLADLRIAEYDSGTVINVGGNHAQKERLKGTSQEWLGDYLVHQSEEAGGSVVSLVFVAGEIVADFPNAPPDYRVSAKSPENELFRLMNETWPGQIVFLPFGDAVFAEGGVSLNFEDTIYVTSPKRHYDAAVVYPIAHRIPLP